MMIHDPKASALRPARFRRGAAGASGKAAQAGTQPAFSAVDAVVALRATLLTLVRRDGRDLTARQLTALMTVYLDDQVYTVSSMAELLSISRPGVTRIIDRLAEYDLVEREEDHADRRRVLIRRTSHGEGFMRDLNEIARRAPAGDAD